MINDGCAITHLQMIMISHTDTKQRHILDSLVFHIYDSPSLFCFSMQHSLNHKLAETLHQSVVSLVLARSKGHIHSFLVCTCLCVVISVLLLI